MKHIKKIILNCLCFFAFAPIANAETLLEALSYAYDNNPGLLAQRSYYSYVEEQMPQAKAGFKPTVSLGSSVASKHTETNDGTKSDRNPYGSTISISQPLFSGFSTVHSIRNARNSIKAESANLRSKEQDVLLETVTAYMNVVRDGAVLELRINNEQVLSRKLEATIDRYNVGEITKTDVAQAEARLMEAQASRILAEGELETSKAYYLKTIGKVPTNLEKEPQKFASLVPTSLEEAIRQAIEYNPTIAAAKYSLKSSEEEVRIARADFMPTLSLNGSAGKSWNQSSNNDSTESMQITANLDIPIYTAGVTSSKLRGAKHVVGQKRNSFNETVEAVKETVTSAYKNLSAIQASIRATIAQVDAAEIALEGVEKEEEVGSRTLLDVLDAEQELLDAKVGLVEAKRDEMVISASLLVATGQFLAHNIGLK